VTSALAVDPLVVLTFALAAFEFVAFVVASVVVFAVVLAELLPSVLLLRNTVDIAQDPCKLLSRRGRSLFRSDCKRTPLEDLDGRSIVLVPEL
jgi:hypothetical protein